MKIFKSSWKTIVMVLFVISCEKEVMYDYDITSITSSNFIACSQETCPALDISFVILSQPEPLAQTANNRIARLLKAQLLFEGQTANSIEQAVEMYLNSAQTSYPENSVFSEMHELQLDISVSYTSNEVFSIQMESYEFAGGAHGISALEYMNFNPKTGEEMTVNQLVRDKEGFTAFAKAEFIKTHGALDKFMFRDNVFTLPENIGFNENGMILYYNVYEIAPYAEGVFKVELSWNQAEGFLNF